MKFAIASSAALALALAAAPAWAASVNVTFANGGSPTASDDIFQNFNSTPVGTSLGTNAAVYNGTTSGIAARPAFGSTGNYGAVLGEPTDGSAHFAFGPTGSFGFTLGSLDTYNALQLFFDDLSSVTLTSGQIINGMSFPSGNQSSNNSNGFVRIYGVGANLVGATFKSTSNSFEFDNLATGVPEPTTWAMMILGLGVAGAAMRRRQTVSVKYA